MSGRSLPGSRRGRRGRRGLRVLVTMTVTLVTVIFTTRVPPPPGLDGWVLRAIGLGINSGSESDSVRPAVPGCLTVSR